MHGAVDGGGDGRQEYRRREAVGRGDVLRHPQALRVVDPREVGLAVVVGGTRCRQPGEVARRGEAERRWRARWRRAVEAAHRWTCRMKAGASVAAPKAPATAIDVPVLVE